MHFLLDKFLILILFVCLYDLYFSPFSRVFDYVVFLLIFIILIKKELLVNDKISLYSIVPFSFGILFFGIVCNIALLAYYKYADSFIENFNSLSGSNVNLLHMVLPLSISFFYFQQIMEW